MLAANAQGFAMYLTHGVNATQMQRGFCNVGLGSERAPCSTPSLNLGQAFHTWQCGVIRLWTCRANEHQAWRKLVERVFARDYGCLARRIFEPYCFDMFCDSAKLENPVFAVPVTNLNNLPGTVDTATLALSLPSFCYKILLSSLLVAEWKWGDSRKIDSVYHQQLELSRLAWATPLQEMHIYSDSFTLLETSCLKLTSSHSKEMASIDACTDRAFQAYLTSPATGWRYIRLLVTLLPGCTPWILMT